MVQPYNSIFTITHLSIFQVLVSFPFRIAGLTGLTTYYHTDVEESESSRTIRERK